MANDADPLLQHLISPRINSPPTNLFPIPEHRDSDLVIPMPMSPEELRNRLIFGPFSATSPIFDISTHQRFHRSKSAPTVAAINDLPGPQPDDDVFHRSYSSSKSTVILQAVALFVVYLAVMSVTTVLYGDQALKTLPCWLLSAIWLLVSTLAVSLSFLYLTKARMSKRKRELASRVLGEDMTISQFFAADIDNNGYVSKSEYVLFKLKQIEKITYKDIERIIDQFEKLDRNNLGKIAISDLLETSTNGLSTGTHVTS